MNPFSPPDVLNLRDRDPGEIQKMVNGMSLLIFQWLSLNHSHLMLIRRHATQ